MYSPKIKEELIPKLYQLKQLMRKPMTHIVNEAIVIYLNEKEINNESRNDSANIKGGRKIAQNHKEGVTSKGA